MRKELVDQIDVEAVEARMRKPANRAAITGLLDRLRNRPDVTPEGSAPRETTPELRQSRR